MHKNLPKFNDSNYVHFITIKTYQNKNYFKDEKCCLILLEELNFYREKLRFKILGYVIMPDHLHCLIFWEVDENPKLTISRIMQSVKIMANKRIKKYLFYGDDACCQRVDWMTSSNLPVGGQLQFKFWQSGFYDFNIYTEKKLKEKFDYIHITNPIKAGLCEKPEDYEWSSYRQIMEIEKQPVLKIDFL